MGKVFPKRFMVGNKLIFDKRKQSLEADIMLSILRAYSQGSSVPSAKSERFAIIIFDIIKHAQFKLLRLI